MKTINYNAIQHTAVKYNTMIKEEYGTIPLNMGVEAESARNRGPNRAS